MKYGGLKITEEIIIVENDNGQGYVVEPGNEDMLETAKSWANGWHKDRECFIHTYKNGEFDFELVEAADTSYSSGKLSFWNCNITAPDGKTFLIGISSDLLLCLLKQNTFVNGKLDKKVYLGREKVKVGAFTHNMEEFTQAHEDENRRQTMKTAKKSNKYVPGDIVSTLTTKNAYLGEVHQFFQITWGWKDFFQGREKIYKIYEMPIPRKYHLYYNLMDRDENKKWAPRSRLNESNNKPSRAIDGHDDSYNIKNIFTQEYEELIVNHGYDDGHPSVYDIERLVCVSSNENDREKCKENLLKILKSFGMEYTFVERPFKFYY